MKKQNFACALFSLAFLFSCSEDNSHNSELLPKPQNVSYRISIEEAANIAEEAVAFFDREHPSKSKSIRAANSVSALLFGEVKSSMMKSKEYSGIEISDTLAYVFNFGDSSGYAIISKDSRVETPLLAFVERGSLVNGKTDNPGLALFLKRLEGYMLESIARYGKEGELGIIAAAKGGPVDIGPKDTIVRPLVSVRWGQDEPFNNNLALICPNNDKSTSNGRVKTGCVATAIAQIMSYWKYPTIPQVPVSSWTLLNNYKDSTDFKQLPTDTPKETVQKAMARTMVENLFQNIGKGVKMRYGCDASEADIPDALNFLKASGFSLSKFGPYPSSDIKYLAMLNMIYSFLAIGNPFMATSCDSNSKECHAWVVDGSAKKANVLHLHNNWGWDGKDNGYFLSDVFDPGKYNFQNIEFIRVSK